jgi:hypothetical protein
MKLLIIVIVLNLAGCGTMGSSIGNDAFWDNAQDVLIQSGGFK